MRPADPRKTPTSDFEHGGWLVPFWDEQTGQSMTEFLAKPFDLVLGGKTNEIFAAQWRPTPTSPVPGLNRATKHVASRTLDTLEWENADVLEAEPGTDQTFLRSLSLQLTRFFGWCEGRTRTSDRRIMSPFRREALTCGGGVKSALTRRLSAHRFSVMPSDSRSFTGHKRDTTDPAISP
jgi:hypothetical protein